MLRFANFTKLPSALVDMEQLRKLSSGVGASENKPHREGRFDQSHDGTQSVTLSWPDVEMSPGPRCLEQILDERPEVMIFLSGNAPGRPDYTAWNHEPGRESHACAAGSVDAIDREKEFGLGCRCSVTSERQ